MNEKLIYKDGKALIISDDDKIKEIDYYDNLNKVLQKENLIENLEVQMFKLEQDIFEDEEKKYTKKDVLNVLLGGAGALLLVYIMFGNVFGIEKVVNTTIFGDINLFALITIVGTPLVGLVEAVFTLPMFIKNKKLKRIINGKKTTIKYLKNELEKAKEELLELKNNKTCTKNDKYTYALSIKDDDNIEKIKKYINVYYSFGYYQEKKKSSLKDDYPLIYSELLKSNQKEDLSKKRVRKR